MGQYYDMENCNDRTLTVFGAVRRKTTRLLAENLQISEEQTESKNKDNSHDSWNGKFDAFCPFSIAVFEFQDEVTIKYRESEGSSIETSSLDKTLEALMRHHGSYALSNKLLARFGKLLPKEFKERFKQEGTTTNDTQCTEG